MPGEARVVGSASGRRWPPSHRLERRWVVAAQSLSLSSGRLSALTTSSSRLSSRLSLSSTGRNSSSTGNLCPSSRLPRHPRGPPGWAPRRPPDGDATRRRPEASTASNTERPITSSERHPNSREAARPPAADRSARVGQDEVPPQQRVEQLLRGSAASGCPRLPLSTQDHVVRTAAPAPPRPGRDPTSVQVRRSRLARADVHRRRTDRRHWHVGRPHHARPRRRRAAARGRTGWGARTARPRGHRARTSPAVAGPSRTCRLGRILAHLARRARRATGSRWRAGR